MATNNRHHLFVSYASIDNEPAPGVEHGWVTELVRGLKNQIGGQLGRRDDLKLWMDYELRGNHSITPEITTALAQSEILLLILSPAYLASVWCQRELQTFLEKHSADSGRIFMLEYDEVEKPSELHDLKGFRFYEKNSEGKISKLGWPRPNPDQPVYYEKLDDLSRVIAKKIQQIEVELQAEPTAPEPPEHTVLLAPVTDDLSSERDMIRRFLEQQNIRVLPEGGQYPLLTLEAELKADLEQAELYIQLLNENSGMGIPTLMHQTAHQADKPLLIWHQQGVSPETVSDLAHKQLLQYEKIVCSDLAELQHLIKRRLQPEPELKPKEAQNGAAGETDILLFVNHAPEDRDCIEPLLDELKRRKIDCVFPLTDEQAGSASEFRLDYERNLMDCDALLMLYYDAPATWVREQLKFWRKTSFKREHPVLGLGICKAPDSHFSMQLSNLQLIDCADSCPKVCLDSLDFLKGNHT